MTGSPAVYTLIPIGTEGEFVAVIDDFSYAAERLAEVARSAALVPGNNHYPGHRAPAPPSYLAERADVLKAVLIDAFGMTNGADLIECNFSFVTTPPEQLTPIQRLPHFDGMYPDRLALLHYLCGPEEGGTSFYRHRQTGFERITADRVDRYTVALQEEARRQSASTSAYFFGSNEAFECIRTIEARWNRMIIYRGLLLHSGDVPARTQWPTDQQTARLTINTFLAARTVGAPGRAD